MTQTVQIPAPLVEAGLACLSSYGVRKTSLSDVAARAGVSRATAYRIFGSKQQMLQVLFGIELDRFFAEAQREFDTAGPMAERLAAALDFGLTWIREHPVTSNLLRAEPELLTGLVVEQPDGAPYVKLAAAQLATMIETAPHADQLTATPAEVAELMVRLTISLLLAPESNFPDTARLAHLLINGIAHPT